MEAKHTPGPWKYGHVGDAERYWIGPDWDCPVVAFADRDMPEANARLIAAAPDLLAELVLMRARLGLIQSMSRAELIALRDHNAAHWANQINDSICAAIAKATGEKS